MPARMRRVTCSFFSSLRKQIGYRLLRMIYSQKRRRQSHMCDQYTLDCTDLYNVIIDGELTSSGDGQHPRICTIQEAVKLS